MKKLKFIADTLGLDKNGKDRIHLLNIANTLVNIYVAGCKQIYQIYKKQNQQLS